MKLIKHILTLTISAALSLAGSQAMASKSTLSKPDLEKIRIETTNPKSPYYYPELLKKFNSPDTLMDSQAFQYFYYGTMFQEDYDPYRKPVKPGELESLANIYLKPEPNRSERGRIEAYANAALADNPIDLQQLNHRIFVYEKNGKIEHARIWQYKLNHLLEVIARSGTGADGDNAWIVVYPGHEYYLLNLMKTKVVGQNYEAPYDIIEGQPIAEKDPKPQRYYFNIEPMLDQYYLKHPDELDE